MSRQELIAISYKIINAEGTEQEINQLMELFNKHVLHPDGASLFFWPENYDFRKNDIGNYKLSVEEIVDKCLAYKAIEL